MKRRDLLKQLALGSASLLVLNESLVNISRGSSLPSTLIISLNDPRFAALKNINGAVEIKDSIAPGIQQGLQGKYPLVLVRVDASTISALEKYCTHNGCEIGTWDGSKFQCGCHGSRFTSTGSVLRGPAAAPLKSYPVTLAGSVVTVANLPGSQTWNLTSVEDAAAYSSFELQQNYPNPFNPATTITFVVGTRTHVKLNVLDHAGRDVATLVDDVRDIGTHRVVFDASQLSSGTYFYTLRAGNFVESKQMTLVK